MSSNISIIICCYNSSSRLPKTLAHLQQLTIPQGCQWEVILVDNASTDDTSTVAQNIWAENPVTQLTVVPEPQAGLSHARHRGLLTSRYEVLAFLDDDNWAPTHWLESVHHTFTQHPEICAAGGPLIEHCEATPPSWFEEHKHNFAVAQHQDFASHYYEPLFGAGLCLRKSKWQKLIDAGFVSRLVDRQGKNLSSGGDFELCYALLLNEQKFWYEPRLQLTHFMPQTRITWDYLKRLHIAFGQQSIHFDAYEKVLKKQIPTNPSWLKEALLAFAYVLKFSPWLIAAKLNFGEASTKMLFALGQLGRLKGMLKMGANYNRSFQEIKNAPWATLTRTNKAE